MPENNENDICNSDITDTNSLTLFKTQQGTPIEWEESDSLIEELAKRYNILVVAKIGEGYAIRRNFKNRFELIGLLQRLIMDIMQE